MAHLNMMGNQWNMGWSGNHHFNGSNMSLNMPPQNFMSNDQSMWNPWMQQQQQYPFPIMPNGQNRKQFEHYKNLKLQNLPAMPPRTRSRAASPALSVRSRRSLMSSRSRHKYTQQDLTDDEDSDIDNFTDDSRSRTKRHEVRNRSRRNTEQLDLDHRDTEVISRIQKMKEKSKYIRERRSGSLTNWPTTKDRDSGSLTPSDDEIKKMASRHRKSSLTSPTPVNRRLHSDSASEREKETPKEQKVPQKSVQPLRSDSASEKEVKEFLATTKKRPESDSSEVECKPAQTVPEKRLESETRPLKVAAVAHSSSANLRTSNGLKELPNKKEEVKVTQAEKGKKEERPEVVRETVVVVAPTAKRDETTSKKPVAQPVIEDWECEHCTFVNEAASKICTICCKTRVDVLQQLPTVDDDIDLAEINDSILHGESDAKQKGKVRKISFLPGTKAH